MSLRISAASMNLTRTTGLPSASAFSVCAWVYPVTIAAANYRPLFSRYSTNSIYCGSLNRTWLISSSGSDFTGSTISLNAWSHVAWVFESASSVKLYVNGALDITATVTNGSTDRLGVGVYSWGAGDLWDGRLAHLMVFDGALGRAELLAQMWRRDPAVHRAQLNSWSSLPHAKDAYDYSGRNNHWTIAGAPATNDDPPNVLWTPRPRGRVLRAADTAAILTADVGSFTLTGVAAGLRATRLLTSSAGSFTLTGNAAGLYFGHKVAAAVGTFTLSGVAAGLAATRRIGIGAGSFTLTGIAAAPKVGRAVAAGTGTFNLSGVAAGLTATRLIAPAAGTFSLTGVNAALKLGRRVSAGAGTFVLSGQGAVLTYTPTPGSFSLTAEAGAFALTGNAAGLARTTATPATGAVSGGQTHGSGRAGTRRDAVPVWSLIKPEKVKEQPAAPAAYALGPVPGAFVFTGQPADLRHERVVAASPASYAVETSSIQPRCDRGMLAETGQCEVTAGCVRCEHAEPEAEEVVIRAVQDLWQPSYLEIETEAGELVAM